MRLKKNHSLFDVMEEYNENFTPESKQLCTRCNVLLAPNETRFTTCDACDDASENYHWQDRLHASKNLLTESQ